MIRRSRLLSWRRTFRRPGSVPSHVIAERELQWRARRGLQAAPLSTRNCFEQADGNMKEKVLQTIKPWTQKEPLAILEDPDPSVIVHVASSVYISSDVHAGQPGVEDNFLAPLRPFLHN